MEKELIIYCDKTCCINNNGKSECKKKEIIEEFKDKTFIIISNCKKCTCKE